MRLPAAVSAGLAGCIAAIAFFLRGGKRTNRAGQNKALLLSFGAIGVK